MNRREAVMEGAAYWGSFYRHNIDKFVEDYLHVRLKRFQRVILSMMVYVTVFVLIACRGLGKTYLSGVYCCVRCILWPGQIYRPTYIVMYMLNPLNCWKTLRANSLQHRYEIRPCANV